MITILQHGLYDIVKVERNYAVKAYKKNLYRVHRNFKR